MSLQKVYIVMSVQVLLRFSFDFKHFNLKHLPHCPTYHAQMLHGAGIFTYIWAIFVVNVGKYSIHGAYGMANLGYAKNDKFLAGERR